MKKVKGATILTLVKSIKANHQKRSGYDSILSDKAKEFLKQRILSAEWYPFEDNKERYEALCLVEAKNDPKTITGWGMM